MRGAGGAPCGSFSLATGAGSGVPDGALSADSPASPGAESGARNAPASESKTYGGCSVKTKLFDEGSQSVGGVKSRGASRGSACGTDSGETVPASCATGTGAGAAVFALTPFAPSCARQIRKPPTPSDSTTTPSRANATPARARTELIETSSEPSRSVRPTRAPRASWRGDTRRIALCGTARRVRALSHLDVVIAAEARHSGAPAACPCASCT